MEKVTLARLPPNSEKEEESERLLVSFLECFLERERDDRRGFGWIGVTPGLCILSRLRFEAEGREISAPRSPANRWGFSLLNPSFFSSAPRDTDSELSSPSEE